MMSLNGANNSAELVAALNKNAALELSFKIEREKNKLISDELNFGLWVYDIASKRLEQFRKLDGKYNKEELVIENYREAIKSRGIIHPEDVHVFDAYCDSMDNGEDNFTYELRSIADSYNFVWLRYTGVKVCGSNGKPCKIVGKTLDISDEKNIAAETVKKADIDPITHLPDRAGVKALVENSLKALDKSISHMLFLLDISKFGKINKKWGHLYGDYVLESIAEKITGSFSVSDIIGRSGGDEFIIFCPNIKAPDIALHTIANRLVDSIGGFILKDNSPLAVNVGVSLFPKHGTTYDELYKCADIALYQAKRSAQNPYVLYSSFNAHGSAEIKEFNKRTPPAAKKIRINRLDNIEKKIFDFAFDAVSNSESFVDSLDDVFSEVGKYFGIDGISLIEKNYRTNEMNMLKAWFSNKRYNYPEGFLNRLYQGWDELLERYSDGKQYFIYHSNAEDESNNKSVISGTKEFKEMNVKSILQFPIVDGVELAGIFNFEDRTKEHDWTEAEVATLSGITKIVSAGMLRMRSKLELEDEIVYTGSALDTQKLTYYVINPKTHIIKYLSRYAKTLFPDIKAGEKCYKTVFGRTAPCAMCPAAELNPAENKLQYSLEIYSDKYDAWFTTTASLVARGKEGEDEHLLCWTDVTAFLERVKAKDQLTGVLSFEIFKAVVMKKITEQGLGFDVAIMGIRHFSNINEQFGYEVGDVILKQTAEVFGNLLQSGELLCRIKGDDFVLYLKSYDSDSECDSVVCRLKTACRSLEVLLRGKYPSLNIRYFGGVYHVREGDYSVTALVDKANMARRKAGEFSSSETHTLEVYSGETESRVLEEKELEHMMTTALKEKQFKVYFQPKVSVKTEKISGAEALVRWVAPDGKFIPNFKFIPLFERNGFIIRLDEYVYKETFKYMRKWLDDGKNVPLISMNVSRLHLFDEEFPSFLIGLSEKYGVPRNLLEIEITESVFFDNTERLIEVISKLQSSGFVISMDDFGTGYSTLSLMKSLPIDILKIDGSFFMRSKLDEKNKAVISSIIHLSKKLHLKIVSEGIETPEQVEFLRSEECDFAQGYHYYKPIPAEEFEKLI